MHQCTYSLTPMHLRTHCSTPQPMHQCTYSLTPLHLRPTAAHHHLGFSALTPSLLCTCTPTSAHFRPLTHAQAASHLRTFAPFSTEGVEQLYVGNGAELPCKQIVAPISSGRLYGGIREKSIGYPRKVYRVFPESLESIFRKSIDFSPTLPYKRSVISHPPFRCYGTNDPHPPILHSVSFVEMLCILPFLPQHLPSLAPIPSYKSPASSHLLPQHLSR